MNNGDITVALFGDCATHIAGGKYKHTRAIGLTNWLSIVSPSTENFRRLTKEKLNETSLTNFNQRTVYLDAHKTDLEYLLEDKADYLVIDCNDCRKPLLFENDTHEKCCITDYGFLNEIGECVEIIFGTRGGYKRVLSTDIERAEYKNAVEIICDRIKKIYKPEQIILHKHYYVDSYIDDKGEHKYRRNRNTESDKTLSLIKYIESLLEDKFAGCHIIDFPDDVIIDSNHRFGICSLHYHPWYYEYVREALDVIFRKSSEEVFMLRQLRENYSLRFKMLKIDTMFETKSKHLAQGLDNIVRLRRRDDFTTNEDIISFLIDQHDVYSYLDVLYMLQDKLMILLTTKDTSGGGETLQTNDFLKKLQRLGFLKFPDKLWWMYVGISFMGKALVDCVADESEQPVEVEQMLGTFDIKLKSEAYRRGNKSTTVINGVEYSLNRRGINIVVCSALDGKVLDSVSFDSYDMDRFYRQNSLF